MILFVVGGLEWLPPFHSTKWLTVRQNRHVFAWLAIIRRHDAACADSHSAELAGIEGKEEMSGSKQIDLLFGALADGTRRQVLELLLTGDMTVTDIAGTIGKSVALTSKHIAVLEHSGLVTRKSAGRKRWCRLDPDAIRQAAIWIEGFGQFDPESLELLELLVDEEFRDDDPAA